MVMNVYNQRKLISKITNQAIQQACAQEFGRGGSINRKGASVTK